MGKLARGKKERRNVINANKLSHSNTVFPKHIVPDERSRENSENAILNDLGAAN